MITKNLYEVAISDDITGFEGNAYIFSFEPMDEPSAEYILGITKGQSVVSVKRMEITPAIWREEDHKMMEIISQL